MKLADFHKGQIVYIKETVWEEQPIIHKVPVVSVGRKYITVKINPLGTVRFDATNNFRENTKYTTTLSLYLSKEEIEKEIARREKERKLEDALSWPHRLVYKLSDEDLESILKICEKYNNSQL